ncbi:MAG: hypothetical protein ACRYG5_17445 [Janthinobacterium lividum]
MIKTFTHTIDATPMQFCATIGNGPGGNRVIISRAEAPEALVLMDIEGAFAAIKARLESPEAFIDDAIAKAIDGGLIEQALRLGQPQTGSV